MQRRVFLATAAAVSVAGCSVFGEEDEYDIGMTRMDFTPERLKVPVDTTVVWQNTSGARHTVTAYDALIPEGAVYFATGGYESEAAARAAWERGEGGIDPGETFEHTFTVPGEHRYVCIPHEQGGMDGVIVVEESLGQGPSEPGNHYIAGFRRQ
ncbi:MAG: plastocyanin/azurin family copper-binding protein [Natrialbaceae archaeon]|nr:plastocyanin/azurin family copper-binding protein [Natrialbaceae archaeon]